MRYHLLVIFLASLLSLVACNEREARLPAKPEKEGIFTQFTITGEESTGEVTCVFQFFNGGPDGPTLVFQPGEVMLDSDVLNVDSANVIGSYYEVVRPIDSFTGTHSVTFIDEKGITHKKEFRFQPFGLAEPLPGKIKRQPFTIAVKGVEDGTPIRVVMVDTAFSSPDVNDLSEVSGGHIAIGQAMLQKVTTGPIALQLVMEKEAVQAEKGRRTGTTAVSYALQREFEFID